MKTMKKLVCALMTLVLLLSSVPAVFADEAKTIDRDAACSLTVWKFDYLHHYGNPDRQWVYSAEKRNYRHHFSERESRQALQCLRQGCAGRSPE